MRLHEMSQKICDFLLIQGLTYHRWTFDTVAACLEVRFHRFFCADAARCLHLHVRADIRFEDCDIFERRNRPVLNPVEVFDVVRASASVTMPQSLIFSSSVR